MSEWNEYKLGEIANYINRGISPEYVSENGILVLNQKCIRDGRIDINLARLHNNNKKFSADKKLRLFDILINSTGVGTAGRVGIFTQSFLSIVDNHITILRLNSHKAYPKYVFYSLRNIEKHLEAISEGSTGQIELKRDIIKNLDISLPSLPEQQAIASILSSLDDKIDLLNRQNTTLEKMAETLFRQWFVVEAKEEWKEGTIYDLAIHVKKSICPKKKPTTVYYHYSIPSFDDGKNPVKESGNEIQSNKYEVPKNCILFSKLNPHIDKRVWLLQDNVQETSICSTEFQIIKPKNKEFLYFLYGWLTFSKNYNEIAFWVGGTSGSHQRIDPNSIFLFRCPIIPDNYIEDYNSQIEPIFKKQEKNQIQIRTLTALRDTLLPKLMSGDVKVNVSLN